MKIRGRHTRVITKLGKAKTQPVSKIVIARQFKVALFTTSKKSVV